MSSIEWIISNALHEDLKDGDHSSLACINKDAIGIANLEIKEDGIIAGINIAEKTFYHTDSSLKFKPFKKDGNNVKKEDIVFTVKGNIHSILKAERLVLNLMQRMSGIATKTAKYVAMIKGTGSQILDTRKTSPNLRLLEKEAVKIGGGINHRMGLYDMIMLKDNHIDFAGGINKAIHKTHKYLAKHNLNLKVEIEVRSISELEEVLQTGDIDIIMLDNFSLSDLRKAIKMINNQYKTEASGNITEDNLLEIAQSGVDYISIGALTHHIKSLDISLKAKI